MKRFTYMMALLVILLLGGCAADDADYTEYNGVKISNEDIAVTLRLDEVIKDDVPRIPTEEEHLQMLARRQVQVDEAERLGLLPSRAAAEANYQKQVVQRIMRNLASDDLWDREETLYFLSRWQWAQEALGLTHDEYCDYVITARQRDMGIAALEQYVLSQPEALSQRGFRPLEPGEDPYSEYVDGLLAQAASAAARN